MRRLFTLLQRELSVFYYSPIAYIVLFLFLILNGLSFWFSIALLNRAPSENTVVQVFFNSAFFWIAYLLVFPVITMRLFAEEFKLGTIETLMTAPVRDWEVVASKFMAALIFYILTIAGVFRLRKLQPNAERPYRAFGYPIIPALYIVCASVILVILFVYRPATTIPGVLIVLIGVPVYFFFRLQMQRDRKTATKE